MYIVIFSGKDGYFGPFKTRADGEQYLKDCKSEGTIISLVKPYALGKIEESEQGGK